MRSIKRIFALLLASVLALSCLTGCHGKKSRAAFAVPESFDTEKEYSITFWAKNDTNKAQTDVYAKAAADFEALYPNIHVSLKLYTDYSVIYQDVLNNIQTATTPNVCITYPDHIATYMTGENVVVPLDELFADGKYGFGGSELRYDGPTAEEMVPKFLDECVLAGKHYAIPYMRSTEACYINKDFVEALGFEIPEVLTWDWVWEVCEAATEKNEDGTYRLNGQKKMFPLIYKSTDNMMISYLRQAGIGYSTAAGEIEIFNDDTRDYLLTLQQYTADGAFTTFTFTGYPGNFLNVGQSVMGIDSTAGATWMGSDAPLSDLKGNAKYDFEMVVKEIPQVDPANPQMISQGPSVCVFNKEDPQEVLASWLFAQFLLTNDVQIAYSQTEGYCPVTYKAQNSAEYQDYLSRSGEDNKTYYYAKIEATKLLMRNTGNTFVTPVFNGSALLRQAAGQLIESVVADTRHKKTVDAEAVEKLFKKIYQEKHLDSVMEVNTTGEIPELGPLPKESKTLLIGLAAVWGLIGAYALADRLKNRRKVKK